MRKLLSVVVALTLGLVSFQAHAQDKVTPDDVMAMIAQIPVQLGHWKPAGFDRVPDAKAFAEAIADTADGSLLGDVRNDAALMAVFVAYEGGFRKCPVGDGGKSLGGLQLQRASRRVACTPSLAVAEWLARAQESMQTCAGLPPEERLASLASGSCQAGRSLVRRRVQVARRVALLAQGEGE